jgi:tetratricopeptide (TPR) repeat protein
MLPLLLLFLAQTPAQTPARAPQTATTTADQGSAMYYFILGRHLAGEGKIDQAVDALKRAIQLAPDSAEPRAELAGIYAQQDNVPAALAAAEDALKVDSGNREANRILGTVFAAAAEERQRLRPQDDPSTYVSRAIAALEIARGDGTGDLSIDLALARLYLGQKRPADAVPLLQRIYGENPSYLEGALLLARAQEDSARPGDAVETLTAVLQDDAGNTRARVQLAELYEHQRRWKEAAGAWAQVHVGPQAANEVASRRAIALLNSGDAEGAEALARGLHKADPADVRAMYVLGMALEARNHFDEALDLFKDATRQAPDNTTILYQYGAALDRTGHPADAEKAFRDLIARDPIDANALNYLGYMLVERGQQLDEAVSLIQRAVKIEPENPSYLDSLGWAYVRQGKLDLADSPLTTAAARQPKNSVIQDHLGDLRLRQHRLQDAIAAWQRAIDGDGDSIDRAKIQKKIADARAKQ